MSRLAALRRKLFDEAQERRTWPKPIQDPTEQYDCLCLALETELEAAKKLLIESRKWQSEGEFGDPLGPECWTPGYADYMGRLEAAIT